MARSSIKRLGCPGATWLALRSTGSRQTISRNLQFSGQPKIAKSLSLITGNHVRGWSSAYYSESLPASNIDATTREGMQILRTAPSSDERAKLSWTVENDELVSGESSTTGPGKQSLLQYLRPMSNDEKVEYEFYYEPGKFEVHPTLGRTAFLLRPEGIQRHWMTEPDTSWKTPADNHFPIEGAQPLTLQAGQWNRVSIETLTDRIKISVNGQVALELPWQLDYANSSFGLFHVKGQSRARVRQITLSGSWPGEMPAKGFLK